MRGDTDPSRIEDPAELPTDEGPEIRAPSLWHRTARLPDGTPIGRLGAYWYVLDRNGCTISEGYHELDLDEDGNYRGRRNARTERVVLRSKPDRSTR